MLDGQIICKESCVLFAQSFVLRAILQKPFVESLVRFRGFEKRLPLDDDEMKQKELEN